MLVRYRVFLDSLPHPVALVIHVMTVVPVFLAFEVLGLFFPARYEKVARALDVDFNKRAARRRALVTQYIKDTELRAKETRTLRASIEKAALEVTDEALLRFLREEVLDALDASETEDWETAETLRRS